MLCISLQITQDNKKSVCSAENRSPVWGCEHDGGLAEFGKWQGDFDDWSLTESATIADARGKSYTFLLQHKFDYEYEKYYDDDHMILANLDIIINGQSMGTFNHPKNKNQSTHNEDGTVNANFKGTVFVHVTCDNACACTVQKRLPVCPIRAELSYPVTTSSDYYNYYDD